MKHVPQPQIDPAILIQITGGVAEVRCDDGIRVCVVDYDEDPDATVPMEFVYLLGAEY